MGRYQAIVSVDSEREQSSTHSDLVLMDLHGEELLRHALGHLSSAIAHHRGKSDSPVRQPASTISLEWVGQELRPLACLVEPYLL